MTSKQVEPTTTGSGPPVLDPKQLPADLKAQLKFAQPTDEDMNMLAQMRSMSHPWKDRNETTAESLEALTKLRPFAQVAKLSGAVVGYFTIERDGPVPGAAYLRNIVVKQEVRSKGIGAVMMDKALDTARDMNRKTMALRVDPSSPSVSFYRKLGFTTVATVVSKKSGKLRLLMSRELS
jgi:ribosomal-protein-alanine N-acetyltransferase